MDAVENGLWIKEDGFYISNNKEFLDPSAIHQYLKNEAYWWDEGVTFEIINELIRNSTLCYGIYEGNPEKGQGKQAGFARVVSDLVRFSWLGDVFVLPQYRGKGLSKWLIETIVSHPRLKGTNFMLATQDAHTLYSRFGFEPLTQVENRLARPLNWEEVYKSLK